MIHGLGGVGKTRLALEVAAAVRKGGRQVWWVSAVDGPNVSAGMQAVGYAAGAAAADFEHANNADVVWRHLERYPDPWLLVLDNADPGAALSTAGSPVADAQGWVRPPPKHGCLLITTREGSTTVWGSWTRRHRMAPLETAHGADVLLDLAPDGGTASSAELLAERLGGLPLALQLAGQAIAQAVAVPLQWADPSLPRSFDAYRTALAEHFGEVFKPPASGSIDSQQARGLVGQTWELSLAVLDSRSIPEARRLLRLLSCFGDAPIPCGLLLNLAILAESELFPAMTGQRLWEVLTALDSSSLITLEATSVRGEVGPMAVVHPVVRDTNRAHPEVRDAADTYYQLVIDLLSDAAAKMANQVQVGILVAHIADPLANPLTQSPDSGQLSCPGANLRKLAVDTADDLNEQAMYAHTEALYQAVLADDTRRVGSYHPDTLATRQELALARCGQGRFAEAEQALTSILAIREERLGSDHPDTLMTRNELARVWREQGRFAEAEQALASILAIREERLGSDHPETLRTRRELALVWRRQGRLAEAEQAFRSIRAVFEEWLGSDHPETLMIRTELARVWSRQGRLAEAEQAYISVLGVRAERLGSDHLDTLMTRQELALVWRGLGRLAEAEQALTSILAIREERLGSDHAYNVGTRQMLAFVWRDQGRLAEAEQALTSILATSKWLGSDNLFTLATRHELAFVWRDQGRLAEAEQALTSILAIREERLGSDHPDTLATRHELAFVWRDQGRLAEAEQALTSVLAIREERLGSDHPDTIATRAASMTHF